MASPNNTKTRQEPKFVDDIVRQLAADEVQTPILAYPRNPNGADDYEKFTGHDLDRFVDATVKQLMRFGLEPGNHEPVGLYAQAGVDFVATLFALSRLGYSVLLLSLRLGPVAIEHLLKQTGCHTVIHSPSDHIERTMQAIHKTTGTKVLPMVSRDVYDVPIAEPRFEIDPRSGGRDTEGVFLIFHSSGSTGLPKPVVYSHSKRLQSLLNGDDMDTFISRPLYYGWSLATLLHTMYYRKLIYLFNTSLALNSDNLIRALHAAQAEHVLTTPYNLELMAATANGVDNLKAAKMVSVGGAHLSDELGERLTAEGVHLNNAFGSGEGGVIAGSGHRPAGDPTWDYFRFLPWIKPHIHMEPAADDPTGLLHELIYLPSHAGLVAHNSDYPVPGSYRSKDMMVRHPTIPDAWKFVARADDMITLSGGTNVIPLPLEADVRGSSPLVREAVVTGIGRANTGLLVFRTQTASEGKAGIISPDDDSAVVQQIIKAIWPAVERQNALVEDVAQIPINMIRVLPPNAVLPATDKGNVIRSRVYKEFANEIDELYGSTRV